ncbi:MAG: DNA-binding MarR family transcriptional regulator [Roseivirga sp.]|jgi:DNA-binding MarR family transcriptional regulator
MKREETVDHNVKMLWHGIHRMYNQQAVKHDITTSIGFVLLIINSKEGTPATKIAPLMGLESRSLTRMLKSMEEKKYIYREKDPTDGRSVRIFLTDLGKEKREISRATVLHFNEHIKQSIEKEKLDVFFEVVDQINSLIDKKSIF